MITRDDWLAALKDAQAVMPEQDPAVLTTSELAQVFDCAVSTAEFKVKALIHAGKAERTTKVIRMTNGGLRRVSAWRLLK